MVSIIVPIYNGEKYLRDTLQYILSGSYQDIEIIAVDDGSSDGSREIAEEFAGIDARVKYFHKKNGGIVSARNCGLSHASGEYVCFVDQDDILEKDAIKVLLEDIENSNADFVQGGTDTFSNESELAKSDFARSLFLLERGSEEYRAGVGELVFRHGVPVQHQIKLSIWGKLYKRNFLVDNNIIFRVYCDYEDDWIFVIEAAKRATRIGLESFCTYHWRNNMDSESRNRIKKDKYIDNVYEHFCDLRSFLLSEFEELKFDRVISLNFCRELQKMAILWTLSNETGRGIEGRSYSESVEVMRRALRAERKNGIMPGMVFTTLPLSVFRQKGVKRIYYICRDMFLTFLCVWHFEGLAVTFNKKIFHGRWHL